MLLWSLLTVLVAHRATANDVLAYIGGAGQDQLRCVAMLSDGTFLIGGGCDRLDWISKGVPQVALSGPVIEGTASGKTAFILHVSGDLQKLLHVVTLPAGAAHDVQAIQTTNIPGATTGELFISGRRGDEKDGSQNKTAKSGYYLAKLDGNFVPQVPTRCVWVNNVWAQGSLAENPAWDVGFGANTDHPAFSVNSRSVR